MARHLTKTLEEIALDMGQQKEQRGPQLSMKLSEFAQKVGDYPKLGEHLYNSAHILEIARELKSIAENAEAYVLKEQGSDWFDGVTVKRNMKEMKNYVNEFVKVAKEAHGLNQRLAALYEDSGRVLGRYFEISDGGDDVEHAGWMRNEKEKQVHQTIGMKEAGNKKTYDFFIIPKGERKVKHNIAITATSWKDANDQARRRYSSNKYIVRPVNEYQMNENINRYRLVLNEETVTEYPKGDWVKLDVPEFRIEVAKKFEKMLKDEGYKVLRLDWVQRSGWQNIHSEFFVPVEEFNEANEYAVKNYSFIKDSVPPGILVSEGKKKELSEAYWGGTNEPYAHVSTKNVLASGPNIKKIRDIARRLGGWITDWPNPVRRPQGGQNVWQFKFKDHAMRSKFVSTLNKINGIDAWVPDDDEIVD